MPLAELLEIRGVWAQAPNSFPPPEPGDGMPQQRKVASTSFAFAVGPPFARFPGGPEGGRHSFVPLVLFLVRWLHLTVLSQPRAYATRPIPRRARRSSPQRTRGRRWSPGIRRRRLQMKACERTAWELAGKLDRHTGVQVSARWNHVRRFGPIGSPPNLSSPRCFLTKEPSWPETWKGPMPGRRTKAEQGSRKMRLFRFGLADDAGTEYRPMGGGHGGSHNEMSGEAKFAPAPPTTASTLTLTWLDLAVQLPLS